VTPGEPWATLLGHVGTDAVVAGAVAVGELPLVEELPAVVAVVLDVVVGVALPLPHAAAMMDNEPIQVTAAVARREVRPRWP
jgi:hypothetical protein